MQVDFIVVGQGISGSFLSYFLLRENQQVLVIDDNRMNSPSKIAAGIINPVTGRRMVTVWLADEVIPFANTAYAEIGRELGITAISQKNIVDFFPNPFMRENFLKRLGEDNEYLELISDEQQFAGIFNYEFGCGTVRPVYTAHLESLLPAWRKKLKNHQQLLEEEFDYSQLRLEGDKVRYRDIVAKKIIFCEGPSGADHSLFKALPFAANKGEALVVEIPGLSAGQLYKKSILLAPLATGGPDLFWAGSNYTWDFDNDEPTAEFRMATERSLKEWLKIPFRILEHRAGIRPATVERRPFVGMHPVYPLAGILNGMGTKGCSLAPFFARQLTDHLLRGTAIYPEADVRRFSRVLFR